MSDSYEFATHRRSSGDRSGSSARILLALSAARRRRVTCLMEQETDVINVRPRTVQCPSDPRAPLLSASQPRSASSSEMSADQPSAAATAASRASWHRRAPAGGRCRGSSVDACRPLRRAERRRAPRVCRRRLTRPSRSHDEPRDPWGSASWRAPCSISWRRWTYCRISYLPRASSMISP